MGTTVSDSKVGGKPIIRAWESFSGWYWFAVEEAYKQDSVIDNKVHKGDIIFFGFVAGICPEWGYFSLAELESLSPKIWELPKEAISWVSLQV